MKTKEDELKLEVMFNSANYGQIACNIKILDGVALAFFSDRRLARDMYFAEKRSGNPHISFKERLSCLGENYPNKTKEDIAKELIKKFQEHNDIIIQGTKK